jgi:hypothetical protein
VATKRAQSRNSGPDTMHMHTVHSHQCQLWPSRLLWPSWPVVAITATWNAHGQLKASQPSVVFTAGYDPYDRCNSQGHLWPLRPFMALWHVTPTASCQMVCFDDRFVGVTPTPSSNQHTHQHTVLACKKILINEIIIFVKENIYTYINVYYINIYICVYI